MLKYVIEREPPGAGKLSAGDLQAISQKSNKVISDLEPEIRWLHSYITDNTMRLRYTR
jgi:Protein of unknown function (DUF4242)